MSHFITAIITKNPSKFDEELAPYQENNMGDCPKEFMEFVDETENFKKSWQEDSVEKVKLPNGNYIYPWDDRLKVTITKEEYEECRKNGIRCGSTGWRETEKFYRLDPEVVGGTLVKVPYRDIYSTLDEYVKDCEGENLWDNEMKAYGYWRNPNSKWDSYSLCRKGNYGRWQNPTIEESFYKVKEYPLYKDKQDLINEYNKALEQSKLGKHEEVLFRLSYGEYKSAEDYAERNRVNAPWAFVLDKKWAERGQMGWWATSDKTDESEEAFIKLFEKIMTDPQYEDYYIGFVNCHI